MKGKLKVERYKVVKKCKKCDEQFEQFLTQTQIDGVKYNKQFCSRICANTHVITDEQKEKTSNSLKNSEVFQINNKIAIANRVKKDKIIHKFTCEFCHIESITKKQIPKVSR